MAETTQILFSHKEVVEALIKSQGIHEGIWGLHVKFGMQAINVGLDENNINPGAIVPILALGLQKFEQETSISLDASKVNPKPRTAKSKGTS